MTLKDKVDQSYFKHQPHGACLVQIWWFQLSQICNAPPCGIAEIAKIGKTNQVSTGERCTNENTLIEMSTFTTGLVDW